MVATTVAYTFYPFTLNQMGKVRLSCFSSSSLYLSGLKTSLSQSHCLALKAVMKWEFDPLFVYWLLKLKETKTSLSRFDNARRSFCTPNWLMNKTITESCAFNQPQSSLVQAVSNTRNMGTPGILTRYQNPAQVNMPPPFFIRLPAMLLYALSHPLPICDRINHHIGSPWLMQQSLFCDVEINQKINELTKNYGHFKSARKRFPG